jgi:hypothetical protein
MVCCHDGLDGACVLDANEAENHRRARRISFSDFQNLTRPPVIAGLHHHQRKVPDGWYQAGAVDCMPDHPVPVVCEPKCFIFGALYPSKTPSPDFNTNISGTLKSPGLPDATVGSLL